MKCNNCGKFVEYARHVIIEVQEVGQQYPTPFMITIEKHKGILCAKCYRAKSKLWKKWLGDD